jgi:hypothetical protein
VRVRAAQLHLDDAMATTSYLLSTNEMPPLRSQWPHFKVDATDEEDDDAVDAVPLTFTSTLVRMLQVDVQNPCPSTNGRPH